MRPEGVTYEALASSAEGYSRWRVLLGGERLGIIVRRKVTVRTPRPRWALRWTIASELGGLSWRTRDEAAAELVRRAGEGAC